MNISGNTVSFFYVMSFLLTGVKVIDSTAHIVALVFINDYLINSFSIVFGVFSP